MPAETPEERLARLATLIATSPHNLVSRADRAVIATRHIPEIVAVAPVLPLLPGERWLDLGSGGGLPGLVLAILRPDVHWVLLDSVRKKTDAVRGFSQELGLANVTAVHGRAEDRAHDPTLRGQCAGVVSRAVASVAVLAELARGFVRPGGHLAAIKGRAWSDELRAAATALATLGWGSPQARAVSAAPRPTWVVMMRAERAAPPGFPRRAGIPQRRPLGTAG